MVGYIYIYNGMVYFFGLTGFTTLIIYIYIINLIDTKMHCICVNVNISLT